MYENFQKDLSFHRISIIVGNGYLYKKKRLWSVVISHFV